MTEINKVMYDDLLGDAKMFYQYIAIGDKNSAYNYLDNFYKKSFKINPSITRMSLQQAQNDILYKQYSYHYEDKFISERELFRRDNNIKNTSASLGFDYRIAELDNRIKQAYPKTWKKRIAIISHLMDSEKHGLAKTSELKSLKKFHYLLLKVFAR